MAIFQQDNVLQWLFEGDPVCSSGYFGDTTQHDPDIYHGQYVGGQFETECSNIENDEIIAQALQEEFSQLSITEETGFSHVEQEHMQVPVHKSDWLSPSTGNYYSGHESGQEETDDIDISSLCSSPEVKLYDGEEYSYPLELTDESAFDGEVGKILNQMISVRMKHREHGGSELFIQIRGNPLTGKSLIPIISEPFDLDNNDSKIFLCSQYKF